MIGEIPPEGGPKPDNPTKEPPGHRYAFDPDLRLAWISLITMVLGLLFLAAYPLGHVKGGVGIHDFKDMQQYVLLLAVPLGLGLAVGFFMSMHIRPGLRWRLLWSGFVFFLVQLSVLSRFMYFTPFLVWCRGFLPNPAAWGITFASAGIATLISLRVEPMLGKSTSRKTLSKFAAGACTVILLGSFAVLAPIFVTEWRAAPVVLDDRYELAWELSVPAPAPHHGSGFWFSSRQTAPPGLHPMMEFTEQPRGSESDEAVFLTDRWIGLVRLSDGKPVWGREFAFRVSGNRLDMMSVYVVEDRIHVIVRGPSGDIYTFRKSDGELIWEAKDLGFKYGGIGDLRVGAVPTPNFIVATYADGRPGYMIIDSKTGIVTEHTLPVPDGMKVPMTEIGSMNYTIGPAVLEGDSGALAIAAYFAETEKVPDYWGYGFPLPEKGYLFGLDPETGRVAWQVEDVGNWREDQRWPLEHIWFDHSTVVWTGGYGSSFIRVWDTATGKLRWSRDFPMGVAWACVGRKGVAVRESDTTVVLLDPQTGDLRWTYDPGTWDLYARFFMGDTLILGTSGPLKSLLGIRVADGSVVFSLSNLPDSFCLRGVEDRNLILEIPTAGEAGAVLLNPENGEQTPLGLGDISGVWDLEVARYLLSIRKWTAGDREDRHDLFKAEGELQLLNTHVRPLQTHGSLGEVTREGSVLVTSYDDKAGAYRIYLLRLK